MLVALVEEWKKALDENKYVGAIITDLSMAFDCIPHKLLLEKLKAYGLCESAVSLIHSYLSDRKQCVRIGDCTSEYMKVLKGVPQGSILGPLLFNIFLNDIFYCINKVHLFSYADDNTLSHIADSLNVLVKELEEDGKALVDWCNKNGMQANPDKFQGFAAGKKTFEKAPIFKINDENIECEENIKLLGINFDYLLTFDTHVNQICRKASNQINVLKRIGKNLTLSCRKAIFHSFIMSIFNFCPLVWHHCSATNVKKLERIHIRALRFVYQDFSSSPDEILTKANVATLKLSWLRLTALEVFKIINGERPTYLSKFIVHKDSRYNFRYTNMLNVPSVKTEKYGKRSFRYTCAKIWNDLPQHIRLASTSHFKCFKKLLMTWTGSVCKCTLCRS